MSKIPIHKISERLDGELAFIRYVSDNGEIFPIEYAHRDDYYIFAFIEKGEFIISVDFEEYRIEGPAIRFVLPGQVHHPVRNLAVCGWMLLVDPILVKEEYKEIFEKISLWSNMPQVNEEVVAELKSCISLIHNRMKPERQLVEQSVVHSLISSYIGMFAEICQSKLSLVASKRLTAITAQFKSLLAAQYKTLKSPSQYAVLLNISPVYLNEAVKKTTGLSASEYIRNEIVIQAKRLLFYTTMNVKEVALELGYEDWAYFTRLFTKVSSVTPTQFRGKYLK